MSASTNVTPPLIGRKLARQLTAARKLADQLVAAVDGVQRVAVATHADGSVTVSLRITPGASP